MVLCHPTQARDQGGGAAQEDTTGDCRRRAAEYQTGSGAPSATDQRLSFKSKSEGPDLLNQCPRDKLIPVGSNFYIILPQTIDYWTYEKHVRQYRAIKGVEGRYQEDPNGLRYVLGTFEAPPGIQGSTGNEASTQKSLSRQSGTMTNLVASQDKKYLVQRWENGDHCPLIGKPRKIEIQVCRGWVKNQHGK